MKSLYLGEKTWDDVKIVHLRGAHNKLEISSIRVSLLVYKRQPAASS